MATRYAVATGNWSATATWDGGASLPGAGDDVHSNTFTVTVDQDVTVLSLRNTAGGSASAGGGFVLNSGRTATLTGSGVVAGTATCVTFSAASPAVSTIVGTIAPSSSGIGVAHTGTGRLNITGNVTPASSGTGVVVSGGGRLDVTGNVTGGSPYATAVSITSTANATVNVTGNVYGGALNARGINANAVASTITVVGDVTGGTATNAPGIDLGTIASTVTVTGNLLGGSAASTQAGVSSTGAATVTVTGNVTGGGGGPGFSGTSGHSLTVTGTVTASSGASAIESSSTSATNVLSGPFVNHSTSGQMAVYARRVTLAPVASDYWRFNAQAGGTVDLVSTDSLAGLPDESDVRSGVSYGGGTLTGTCAVPAAGAVASGVAVDDTVGSALLTAADVWAVALATAGGTPSSIGERLAAAATTDQVGQIVAALGP